MERFRRARLAQLDPGDLVVFEFTFDAQVVLGCHEQLTSRQDNGVWPEVCDHGDTVVYKCERLLVGELGSPPEVSATEVVCLAHLEQLLIEFERRPCHSALRKVRISASTFC